MGAPKAFVEIDGTALVSRVAAALRAGGAGQVVAVGGDLDRLAGLGLDVVADQYPGQGPLGGVLTALRQVAGATLVVAACDQPWLDGRTIAALVAALSAAPPERAAAVAVSDRPGRRGPARQPLPVALRPGVAEPPLSACFDAGDRSLVQGFGALPVVEVAGLSAAALRDADEPHDLLPS